MTDLFLDEELSDEGEPDIGRSLVGSTVGDITWNLYIASLGIDNYEIKYKFNINDTLELGLIAVTEHTKTVRCAFLHCCSDRYQHLCYVSRRRVERLFNKEVQKYPLEQALEKNLVSKREVNLYLKDNNNYKKYLEVLSKIFELSIILLEYNETKNVEIIRNGTEFICILKKNETFIPVCINSDFNINPEFVEIIVKYFIENMRIDTVELKETEDLEVNKEIISSLSRRTFNPSYDDNLYSKDRNAMIIRNLVGNTKEEEFKKEKEEFEKKKEQLNQKETELKQKEEELKQQQEAINKFLSTMQVQRGRGDDNTEK